MRDKQSKEPKNNDRITRRSGTRIGRDSSAEPERVNVFENKENEADFNKSRTRNKKDDAREKQNDIKQQASKSGQASTSRRHEDDIEEKQMRLSEDGKQKNRQNIKRQKHVAGTDAFVHQIVPYALFWVALFAAVSFILRDLAGLDFAAGALGNWFADFLCGLLGIGAYLLPFFFMVFSLRWRKYVRAGILGKRIFLTLCFLVLLSGIIHVFQDADPARRILEVSILYPAGVARTGGGLLGGFVGEWLGFLLRLAGTCLLAIPLLVIIAIYMVGMTPSGLWERIDAKIKIMKQRRREARIAKKEKETQKHSEEHVSRSANVRGDRKEKNDRQGDGDNKPDSVVWKEPQPLQRGQGKQYDFHENEPDVTIDPPRRRRSVSEDTKELFPNEERSAFAHSEPSRELLDIEDDDLPMTETSAAAQTILQEAGHAQDGKSHLESILNDMVNQTVTAQPVQTANTFTKYTDAKGTMPAGQEKKDDAPSNYYAPFALPVRPEPKRTPPSEHVARSQTNAVSGRESTEISDAQARQTTSSKTFDSVLIDRDEEVLGNQYSPVASNEDRVTDYHQDDAFHEDTVFEDGEIVSELYTASDHTDEEKRVLLEEANNNNEDDVFETYEGALQATKSFVTDPQQMHASREENGFENAFSFQADDDELSTDKQNGVIGSDEESACYPEDDAELLLENIEPTASFADVERQRIEPNPLKSFTSVASHNMSSGTESKMSVPVVQKQAVVDDVPPPPPIMREYEYPPLSLLNEDKNIRNQDFYEEIEETKRILRDTLDSFNIHIQNDIQYSHGPSVTRYEFRPAAGTSVRSVTSRIEDIALNLASSVRIESPIPGKPAIGIEVPNKVRETVYMRTMLESSEFCNSQKPLEVPLGLDVGGAVKMCNLAAMPHLLVAGTTGSGKSVCINSILVSLIYKTSPRDLRLILIDPKQVEFAPYEHVPHLYMPIVTDMQRAAGALACAVQEMERRFTLIKDVGVRNIEAYNEVTKNDPEREHLPYIIIVIDEFADLKMSCSNNDPENFTCRLAQKARAAGIHLVIGTQRPSVDVITGKLKTNIPSRIAFMVKQQVDSRTILDVNGAESLTGRGDMLYMPTNSQDKAPNRIQGAFVSDGELERVMNYVRNHNDPVQYNQAFMDQIEVEMAKAANAGKKDNDSFDDLDGEDGEDPKFLEAVKLAVETQKVATSLLQRRLGVGYGRAAKIVDRMEELGLVSSPDGNKPRQILPAAQGYLNHMMVEDEDVADDFNDYH